MKKFIIRSVIFLIIALAIPAIFLTYLYITKRYETFVNGFETYASIRKSKERSDRKKLLLGDSVAKQMVMYNKDNTNVNSLACNQAISMVGQYILFKNYLAAGNKIDTAILLMNPVISFKNNLDQLLTFHYFLKPFYKEQYKPEFSPTVIKQIEKIPYYKASQFPLITASNWSPQFKSHDPEATTFLSPISLEYLYRIKHLAEENNIVFLIYPPPLRKSLKSTIDSLRTNAANIPGLEKEFALYFSRMKYIEDKYYVDGPHFKKEYLRSHSDLLAEVLN